MLLFKTLRFLWPFLKEMILGDKSLKEALKTNFWRVALIAGILASVAVNFFVVPRLLEISYEHVELKRKHSALIKQCWPNSDPNIVVDPKPAPAAPAAPAPVVSADEEYRKTKELFERLRLREH